MTCKDVALITGISQGLARKWAGANEVHFSGVGNRKTYIWSVEDLQRFNARFKKPNGGRKPQGYRNA